MEHRARHSRARRRHADPPPADPPLPAGRHGADPQPPPTGPHGRTAGVDPTGRRTRAAGVDLTAADLRTLRELLAAEDRADTPDVPRAVSDPEARPRHRPRRHARHPDPVATPPDHPGRRSERHAAQPDRHRPQPEHQAAPLAGRRSGRHGKPDRRVGAEPAWPRVDADSAIAAIAAIDHDADTEIHPRALVDPDDDDESWLSPRAQQVLVAARRGLAGLMSLVVLACTGYGWASVSNLQENLNTTDVIIAVPKDMPGDGATDILLVGSDSRTDANGNPLPLEVLKLLRTEESAGLNTDTIILIRVPDDGGNAYAVSIPRDTYVPIPGYREDKINTAYGVSKRMEGEKLRAAGVTDEPTVDRQAAVAGQRVLVQTVEELTGARIDHYAEINLYGFYLLTEAVGGVEVCLKRSTKDSDSGADFTKGRQLVSGGDALAFVRQRKNLPRGDLDRIVRQQVFMAALASRMLGAGTLTDPGKLSGLMDAAQKSIVLDDGWDVLGFAGQLNGLAAGDVEFVTIPVVEVGARNERGQSIITVDPVAVRTFVSGLLGEQPAPDQAAPPPPTTAPTAPPTAVDPSSVIVSALNGTNRGGLAGRVLDTLADGGFRVGRPDNAPRRDRTEIRVAPGARAVGERIAATLGVTLPIVEDPTLAPDRARITLGADYTGPDAQQLAAAPLLHLDGALGSPRPAQTPPPDDDAPITAEGITCVN